MNAGGGTWTPPVGSVSHDHMLDALLSHSDIIRLAAPQRRPTMNTIGIATQVNDKLMTTVITGPTDGPFTDLQHPHEYALWEVAEAPYRAILGLAADTLDNLVGQATAFTFPVIDRGRIIPAFAQFHEGKWHVEGRSYFTLTEFQHAENPPLPFVRVPAIQEANNAQ